MNNEKRWKQRFENFEKSFNLFCRIQESYKENPDSEPHQMALVQSYEISVELSWNTLKDYLINSGYDVETPKQVIRQAFKSEVITQAEEWMEAIRNRNRTSHIYRASILKEILAFINDTYFSILRDLYYILKKEIDSQKRINSKAQMKYGLSESQFNEIIKIISSYPEVEELVLFGSRAINTFKEASDIDLAIKGKKVNHKLIANLKFHFEEETDLPFFFDFISYPHISNKKLKEHIDKYGILIYRKGWKQVKLGDAIILIGGGTPKTSIQEYWNGDIPWLSVTDFNTGRKYVYNSEKNITKIGLKNSNARILNKGDIIISARGTVGVISMIGREMAFNQSCYGIMAKDDSFNNFIYYLLKNTVNRLQQISHGGVFDTITRSTFNEIEISLPPLPEQEAIAEVLSSLDDKIELLHKQNKPLENMAQTLFHKWFIEDAQDDWEEKQLDEIADYLNGLACQKYPPKNEIDKLPVLKIKELRNGFTENSDWATSGVEDKYIIELGDIIFSWSGSLLIKIWNGQKCILNQHLFKVTSKQYPKWFYYFWTKYYMEKFVGIADSKATTMGHIKRGDLSNSMALVPSKKSLLKMNGTINSFFERVILNFKLIAKLEKMRDVLLPQLIRGTVRIKKRTIQ